MKAMEVDEKPSEDYSDIGGLDKQIQELVEAIVLPVTHKARSRRASLLHCWLGDASALSACLLRGWQELVSPEEYVRRACHGLRS